MMYYVYVLRNKQGKHYIGSTENIGLRLKQHNQDCVTATKNRGPYGLVYQEEYATKAEAVLREKQIKSYKGGEAFKRLMKSSTPSSSLV